MPLSVEVCLLSGKSVSLEVEAAKGRKEGPLSGTLGVRAS